MVKGKCMSVKGLLVTVWKDACSEGVGYQVFTTPKSLEL